MSKPLALSLLCLVLQTIWLPARAFGVLDRVRATETLIVAYSGSSYPISFNDDSGRPKGYAIDLCKRIAASIQRDLALDELKIRWVEGNTPRRVAAVANREADMECGTTTLTLERQEQVDFSNVFFVETGGVLVLADAGIGDLPDLSGKRVAVVPETGMERRLRTELHRRLVNSELIPVRDAADGLALLLSGKVDALAHDRLVLDAQTGRTGDPGRFKVLDAQFSVDPYAFALVRDDSDFRLAVNRGLARVYRTGEIRRLFSRWLGTEPDQRLSAVFLLFGFED